MPKSLFAFSRIYTRPTKDYNSYQDACEVRVTVSELLRGVCFMYPHQNSSPGHSQFFQYYDGASFFTIELGKVEDKGDSHRQRVSIETMPPVKTLPKELTDILTSFKLVSIGSAIPVKA